MNHQQQPEMEKEESNGITDDQTLEETIIPPPPTYEEAMAAPQISGVSESSQSLITYHDLGVALQNLKVETGAQKAAVLCTQDNVQIYFISPDGLVTAPVEPETFQIFSLEDEGSENKPKLFLQVGGWIYPLVPGVSPCYRINQNTFVLPDVHSPVVGSSVGLVFPLETDDSVFELLEDILESIATRSPPPRKRAGVRRSARPSYSISRGIVTGAQYISSGLIKGAEKASGLMNYGTPKLMEKINPDLNPRVVNPKVSQGLQVAKSVTGTAVNITGFIATQVGNATMALGRFLAPHIQSQGTKLLTSTCNLTQQEASERMDGVLEMAAGAVEGFSTVYEGLEHSAGILATSLANNTVKIVEHKYGPAVGAATGDYLQSMGNVFVAGSTIRHLTPKGLAKVTAKATGKAVVEDYRNSLKEGKNEISGSGSN